MNVKRHRIKLFSKGRGPLPFGGELPPDSLLGIPEGISSMRLTLAQLPQLWGYFDRKLLILHNPKKKVVTTNYVS